MKITCRQITKAEFQEAFAIRLKVFVEEQNVPLEIEHDQDDETATHFGAFINNQMIATGRLVITEQGGKIGRMAVLKEHRRNGVGLKLLKFIVAYCQAIGLKEAYLSSQTHALGFYEKAGFVAEGGIYDDAGIPHRTMRKFLNNV